MAEYSGSIEIEHPAAEVFAFLADPQHMLRYLPTVRQVAVQGREDGLQHLEVAGEVEGRAYHDAGWLRTESTTRRLDWGSDSRGDYHGRLEVRETPAGTEVTVMLASTPTGAAAQRLQREAGSVEHGMRLALERVLGRIKAACEAGLGGLAATDDAARGRVFGGTAKLNPEI